MTTNREGRRFESCRARHRKPRKSRGFALNVHPFSWLESPFDRNKGLEVAFRVLLASCPVRRRLLFGCWARRAAYRMGAHDDERQFSGCFVLCSALVYTAVHLYTRLNSPATGLQQPVAPRNKPLQQVRLYPAR